MLKGKDGVVYFNAERDKMGAVQNWNIDEQADIVSGWGMGDEYESSFTTVKRWTGACEVYLDPSDASHAITIGDEIPIELYPGGEASGSGYFSGNVIITGLSRSGSKDGIPTLNINFQNQGGLAVASVA